MVENIVQGNSSVSYKVLSLSSNNLDLNSTLGGSVYSVTSELPYYLDLISNVNVLQGTRITLIYDTDVITMRSDQSASGVYRPIKFSAVSIGNVGIMAFDLIYYGTDWYLVGNYS